VLENYFTAIRLKSQINAGDKSSQGGKGKSKPSTNSKKPTSNSSQM
jgi:hypothetical protein